MGPAVQARSTCELCCAPGTGHRGVHGITDCPELKAPAEIKSSSGCAQDTPVIPPCA